MFREFAEHPDEYWNSYLKKLNLNLKKSKEDSEKNYDDYFKLITYDEAADWMERIDKFDSHEIQSIKILFPEDYIINENPWKNHELNQVFNYLLIENKKSKNLIKIWKLEDEYYLLSISDPKKYGAIYELCDQFNGLKRLIEKITNTRTDGIHESIFNIFKNKMKKEEEILYRKVSYDEAIKFDVSHHRDKVTKKEVNKLENTRWVKNVVEGISDYGNSLGIRFSYKYIYCTLTKHDDDWFILHTISERDSWRPQGINRYFICDTIDGVIQALKDHGKEK